MAAHVRELKFELEVRNCPQSTDHDRSLVRTREFDGQAGIAEHLDIRQVVQHTACHVHPRFQREHGRFVGICGDCDDDVLEHAGGTAHQILVSVRDRIESTRIDGIAIHSAAAPLSTAPRASR